MSKNLKTFGLRTSSLKFWKNEFNFGIIYYPWTFIQITLNKILCFCFSATNTYFSLVSYNFWLKKNVMFIFINFFLIKSKSKKPSRFKKIKGKLIWANVFLKHRSYKKNKYFLLFNKFKNNFFFNSNYLGIVSNKLKNSLLKKRIHFLRKFLRLKIKKVFLEYFLNNYFTYYIILDLKNVKYSKGYKIYSHKFGQAELILYKQIPQWQKRAWYFKNYVQIFVLSVFLNNPQLLANYIKVVFKKLYKYPRFFSILGSCLILLKYFKGKELGLKISLKGKLYHKTMRTGIKRFSYGLSCTNTTTINKFISFGFNSVKTRYGIFGIKVWIYQKIVYLFLDNIRDARKTALKSDEMCNFI